MSKSKIYLSGPEVFLPDAPAIGQRKKFLCEEFGFVGLYPLDNDLAAMPGETEDQKIFAANVAAMREADAGIFNLTPFRGVNADPGTAFELGFFAALGQAGFRLHQQFARTLFDRVAAAHGVHGAPDGEFCDAHGLSIENFGNADNLMLDGAVKSQRRRVVRPDVTLPDAGDLAGFMRLPASGEGAFRVLSGRLSSLEFWNAAAPAWPHGL